MIQADTASFAETNRTDPFAHQNKKMLKVSLQYGPVMGRTGSMVAYQGDVKFTAQGSGGAAKWLKQKMTGEGVPLMEIAGSGEVFLADSASDVHIFYLDNDMVSVNGANVLAFSASIGFDIQRISGGASGAMAGGLYNTVLQGTGYVAVLTRGEPVILDVASAPTFADANAVVCWTGGVTMNVKTDIGMRDFIGKGSGEAIQMGFAGQGWVMVQPDENVVQGGAQQSGSKGFLGM